MNYFRTGPVQRIAATIVACGLMLSLAIPASARSSIFSDQVAAQLFGRSIEVPVDDSFWMSWDTAQDSGPESLSEFVAEFIRAYERSNDIPNGTFDVDAHALWTVLMGISLNVEPVSSGVIFTSVWKTTLATHSSLRGIAAETSAGIAFVPVVLLQRADDAGGVPASLLTSINPQGP